MKLLYSREQGHTLAATSVAWSPDGLRLATAGGEGTVKIWEALTGRELLTLRDHVTRVTSVAWSPDGRRLATAGEGTVKIWDAPGFDVTWRER